ncbi:hypothetical protein PPYR_05875 [Photinus pyralis]|uniref:EF-hand domain-containing protein n=1 Tax=Photinus pyralis TaxID=7054 RepID=A0A5N4AW11_PHOPY|nr:uncharacterized protein LOC116165279 isoform X2 [Photinus pyralis]KAB0801521.1 hypothetical protein PPYR_05875 [Photinus pyralis]
MESNNLINESTKAAPEGNIKELSGSRSSIKSTKSLEKRVSNTGSIKSEKDVHFANTSFKDKSSEKHDSASLKSGLDPSSKVPHKFIANWKQACDRTRDRTRDLLKRWRTLPECEENKNVEKSQGQEGSGWSVHVWTTWVDRFSIDASHQWEDEEKYQLTQTQSYKLNHFFTCLLDHDRDDLVSDQDFESLSERLRHFADWSINSAEFNILQQVERGFMDTFLEDITDERLGFKVNNQIFITKDGWLHKWAQLLSTSRNLTDFPIWLQYLVKILFQVINRSGSGIISRDELSAFYSSVLGFDAIRVGEILDVAYQAMTSNGDHPLGYRAYRLCFANYLLGRYPNGSGQFLLGFSPAPIPSVLFPIDYSALNTQPEDLEQYTPDQKSNRHSIVV